jgi:hypothetical protein
MELTVPVKGRTRYKQILLHCSNYRSNYYNGFYKRNCKQLLQLKNAFTKDNTNDAATAGKALEAAFKII